MTINARSSAGRLLGFVAGAIALVTVGSGVAFASDWFTSSPKAKANTATATMPGFDSAPAVEEKSGKVVVDWIAQKIVKGVDVERYIVTRYNTQTDVGIQVCGDQVAGTKCADVNVPAGKWKYTVRTVQGTWKGVESRKSAPITIAAALRSETSTSAGQAAGETVAPTTPSATITPPSTSSEKAEIKPADPPATRPTTTTEAEPTTAPSPSETTPASTPSSTSAAAPAEASVDASSSKSTEPEQQQV